MAIKSDTASYFDGREKQRLIAQRLDEAFDITYADVHAGFSFWLASPKHHTQERFGLNLEVLVIYSTYPNTDARVLTAVDSIGRLQAFKHRIEKVVFIVIHQGAKNEEDVLRAHPDRIPVIFQAEEFQGPSLGSLFIRTRIAQSIGSIDLYGMSSPIKSDKYFFGRDDIVQALTTRAITRKENSGLFGLRKTGKTSVLFGIKRRSTDTNTLIVYVDCQNPGIHGGRWWQALERLASRCRVELASQKKHCCRMIDRNRY